MPPLQPSARTLLCLLALLSSFSGGEVWAQDVPVGPGDRVRVWTGFNDKGQRAGPRRTGQITTWTADSLILQTRRGDVHTIPPGLPGAPG